MMETNYKSLPIKDDKLIREGLKQAGFGEYLTSAIELKEYEALSGERCIKATLRLETMNVLSREFESEFEKDCAFRYMGQNMAHGMQLEMVKQLPCISLGDKVIMSREEYEALRRGFITEFRV